MWHEFVVYVQHSYETEEDADRPSRGDKSFDVPALTPEHGRPPPANILRLLPTVDPTD